jgi:hypothetical protein
MVISAEDVACGPHMNRAAGRIPEVWPCQDAPGARSEGRLPGRRWWLTPECVNRTRDDGADLAAETRPVKQGGGKYRCRNETGTTANGLLELRIPRGGFRRTPTLIKGGGLPIG